MRTIKTPSIAAGWDAYRRLVMDANAPQIQFDECKMAFYAGANVLMESIMHNLDPEAEPTADDYARMDAIQKELDDWAATFDKQVMDRFGGKQ